MNIRTFLVWLLLPSLFLFTGCNEQYGQANLETTNGISIYVDDKYKGEAGKGATKIKLLEGNHVIKVSGDSKDGDWHYEAVKKVFIGSGMEVTISLFPKSFPTAQKKDKDRLERNRLEEEQLKESQRLKRIRQEKLIEAKKFGCNEIDEYAQYKKSKEAIKRYTAELKKSLQLKSDIIKEEGYMVPNDYIDLIGYSINGKTLTITIKNKTKNEFNYFWGKVAFADEKLNLIGIGPIYKNYINIKPLQSKKIVIETSGDLLRKLLNIKKSSIFIEIRSIRYKDQFGDTSKDIPEGTPSHGGIHRSKILSEYISQVSNENILELKAKLEASKNKLSKICQNK